MHIYAISDCRSGKYGERWDASARKREERCAHQFAMTANGELTTDFCPTFAHTDNQHISNRFEEKIKKCKKNVGKCGEI